MNPTPPDRGDSHGCEVVVVARDAARLLEKSDDTLTIYGVGFGPVNTGAAAGTIVTRQNSLTNPVQFTFGTVVAATPGYYGLTPSFVGLYQFNVLVAVAANTACH